MTTEPKVMDKLKLASRFESRAMGLLSREPAPIVDPSGGLWMRSNDVAHIADCFTIAAALRTSAKREAE